MVWVNNNSSALVLFLLMVTLMSLLVGRGSAVRVLGPRLKRNWPGVFIGSHGLIHQTKRAFLSSSQLLTRNHNTGFVDDGGSCKTRQSCNVGKFKNMRDEYISSPLLMFSKKGSLDPSNRSSLGSSLKRRIHSIVALCPGVPGSRTSNRRRSPLLLSSIGDLFGRRRPHSSRNQVSARTYFWLRGGGSSTTEEQQLSVATTDLSGKRPYTKRLLDEYPVSVCSVQGWRSYMEDEFCVHADFAACFDGHGGKAVSRYLRQNLYANLQAALPMVLGTRPVLLPQEEEDDATNGRDDPNTISTSPTLRINSSNHDNDEAVIRNSHGETIIPEPDNTANTSILLAPPNKGTNGGFPTVGDYEAALEVALDKVDREVQRISHWSYQGSTAVAVWIHSEDEKLPTASDAAAVDTADISPPEPGPRPQRTLITANVGDSRAVLCRNGIAIELTRDHKPNDPIESERIHQLGGRVIWHGDVDRHGDPVQGTGIYRVNGNLALSRAIGDRSERPAVTADPELTAVPLTDADEFLVLATDGLWDVMSSSDAVAYIRALLENSVEYDNERDTIAALVVEEALRRGSYDNITVVIVWIDQTNGPKRPKKYWI